MTYPVDIERVFIFLLASWGILATCLAIWQQTYMRRTRLRRYYPTCTQCGGEMLPVWYCPRCNRDA